MQLWVLVMQKNALFYFAGDGCGRRWAAEVGGVFGESRCYRVETWMLVWGKLIRKKGPQFHSWGGRADGWLEKLICSHTARKHDCSFIVLHKQMQQNKLKKTKRKTHKILWIHTGFFFITATNKLQFLLLHTKNIIKFLLNKTPCWNGFQFPLEKQPIVNKPVCTVSPVLQC